MCYNLGRDNFNTHFLRESKDPNSRVTCPELLNMVCRYCKTKGHTKGHCPKLKEKNDTTKKTQRESQRDQVGEDGWSTVQKTNRSEKVTSSDPADKSFLSKNPFLAISCEEDEVESFSNDTGEILPALNWGAKFSSDWNDI
jgi:hypothetical protein